MSQAFRNAAGSCAPALVGGPRCDAQSNRSELDRAVALGRGTWTLRVDNSVSGRGLLRRCLKRCIGCSACNFISMSKSGRCSWYSECPVLHGTGGRSRFHTWQVRGANGAILAALVEKLRANSSNRHPLREPQTASTTSVIDWLGRATRGECADSRQSAAKLDDSDCEADRAGGWPLTELGASTNETAAAVCLLRCTYCAQCHYVSINLQQRTCSWHQRCSVRSRDGSYSNVLAGPALSSTDSLEPLVSQLASLRPPSLHSQAGAGGSAANGVGRMGSWHGARVSRRAVRAAATRQFGWEGLMEDSFSLCAAWPPGANLTHLLYVQLLAVRDALDSVGIDHMLTFGSLLGLMRHGGMNPFEADNDVFLLGRPSGEVTNRRALEQLRPAFRAQGLVLFAEWRQGRDLEEWRACTASTESDATKAAGRRLPWAYSASRKHAPLSYRKVPWTDLIFPTVSPTQAKTDSTGTGTGRTYASLHSLPFTHFEYPRSWKVRRVPFGPNERIAAPDAQLSEAFLRYEYGAAWQSELPKRPRCADVPDANLQALTGFNVPTVSAFRSDALPVHTAKLARWWLNTTRRGHCGEVTRDGNCEKGELVDSTEPPDQQDARRANPHPDTSLCPLLWAITAMQPHTYTPC